MQAEFARHGQAYGVARGDFEHVEDGPDASGAAEMADDGEAGGLSPLDEALRLQARLWARQTRWLCLAVVLAGLGLGAGAVVLLMSLS